MRKDKELLENDILNRKQNASTGEPLEMVRGRERRCLDGLFDGIDNGQKKKIRYWGIDRSNAYNAAALRQMPHVKACHDAYHLVSNMNQTLDRIRRFTMKHPSYVLEQFMKGKRYVLLRGRENASRDARATLREWSMLNRNLYIGHLPKEQFRQVFRLER